MPSHEHSTNSHTTASGNAESRLLENLLSILPGLLNRYQHQLLSIRDMVGVELKLNLKCLIAAFGVLLLISCVALASWLGLAALLVYVLVALAAPIWTIVLAVVLMHVIALGVLGRMLQSLLQEIGFSQSSSALKSIVSNGMGEGGQ